MRHGSAPLERALEHFIGLGSALDLALEHARTAFPADRFRVLESSAKKLATTIERAGVQLGAFVHQYERFELPPRGPQGPARIYPWRPRKR